MSRSTAEAAGGWWPGRTRRPDTVFLDDRGLWHGGAGAAQWQRAEPDLAAWREAHAGRVARIVVGAALTHDLVFECAGLPQDDGALDEHVRAQLVPLHGAAALHWPLALWAEPPVACASALHGAALPLDAGDRHAAAQVLGLQPWWTIALARACTAHPDLRSNAAAAVWIVEGALASWVLIRDGRLGALQRRRLAAPTVAAACELAQRLGRDDGVPMASVAVVAHGLDQAGWLADAGLRLVGDCAAADCPPPQWLLG